MTKESSRRWWILGLAAIAQLTVVLDMTVVNVALPSAQAALHFGNGDRQWIVTAYSLAFGSLLLLGGKITDLFGRKWTLIAGLAGFAIASAVGGAATSFGMLAGARAVQGAFAALLAPATLSILTTTFTAPAERTKALGRCGEGRRQDRERRGRQEGSECPLDGARAGKHAERSSGAADRGGDRESSKARDQGPLPAEQVGDLAAEQQQASEREGVGGHDPLPVAVAEVEGGLRRGEGDVHDGHVENDCQLSDGGEAEDPPTPRAFLGHAGSLLSG